jgi:hypothetical protein
MIKKNILLFFVFFMPSLVFCQAETFAKFDIGFSLINSKSLNKITEGFNAGYGTSFGDIRIPLFLSCGMGINYNNWKFFISYAYGFSRKSSLSSLYEFTERINLTLMPVDVGIGYVFWNNESMELFSTFRLGFLYSSLSLATVPSSSDYESSGSRAYGFLTSPGLSFLYKASPKVHIVADFGFQYLKTGRFIYTSDTENHERGTPVSFADGSYLTLNVLGIKFLVGVQLNIL